MNTLRGVGYWSIVVLVPVAILVGAGYWASSNSDSAVSRVGFIGSIAGILGIVIALIQVIDAKRIAAQARDASHAAKEASEATSRELRNNYYRFSLLTARRLLSEVKAFVRSDNWLMAAVRAEDQGEHASQLEYLRPQPDRQWIYVRTTIYEWARHFRTGVPKSSLAFDERKWDDLCGYVGDKIDRECDPLE